MIHGTSLNAVVARRRPLVLRHSAVMLPCHSTFRDHTLVDPLGDAVGGVAGHLPKVRLGEDRQHLRPTRRLLAGLTAAAATGAASPVLGNSTVGLQVPTEQDQQIQRP
jgi:hypothetical protein